MSLPFLRCAFALLALWFAASAAWGAAMIGLTTIVDADAVLVRDVARFGLVEGVALEAGDILETGAKTGIVRTELADGTVLDLGPDTRLLLAPRAHGIASGPAAGLYVLQGWIKLALAPKPAAATRSAVLIESPVVDVGVVAGVIVERVAAGGVTLFQESGQSTIVEPGTPKGSAPRPVKAGETYAWRDGRASVQSRPDPAFVAALPTAFRDTLPTRVDLFRNSLRNPKPLPPPTYADLEPWLTGEPSLRAALLPRWQRLAKVPEFRAALVAHRKIHPEWERILFPPPPPPPPEAVVPNDRPARPSGDGSSSYSR